MLKVFTGALLAVCAATSMAASTTVTVSYDLSDVEMGDVYQGVFSGTDTNNDGLLSLSELSSFTAMPQNPDSNDTALTLADLYSFGDYDIATNTWLANASGSSGGSHSFITWNDGDFALRANYGARATTSVITPSSVPEPASLAMMGLGALALVARRKRLQA